MFAFIVNIATRIPSLILLIALFGSSLYLLGELLFKPMGLFDNKIINIKGILIAGIICFFSSYAMMGSTKAIEEIDDWVKDKEQEEGKEWSRVYRDIIQTENLVHQYGKVQEQVGKQMLTRYPAMVFPKSLLPASKSDIQEALRKAIEIIEYTNYTEDEQKKIVESLRSSLSFLDRFIPDEEANKRNKELLDILNNKEYKKALRHKKGENGRQK